MKVINVTNILGNGTVDTTNTDRYISLDEFDGKYRHFAVQAGDIVVASSGNTYGKVGRVDASHLPLMMNTSVVRFQPKQAAPMEPGFLYGFLRSELFRRQVEAFVTGSAQPNFGPSHLKQMLIPVPSVPEQRRIASILSAYDDLIENNTRRIAILEEMARRLYDEWFVLMRAPGHDGLCLESGLPAGWRRGPISELYEGLYDGPHATPKPAAEGPTFLGIGNLTESGQLDLSNVRHIAEEDFEKWTKRVCPQPGDIVFTYEATLNRYAIIPHGFRGCLGRRLALIRTSPQMPSNIFLYCAFFSAAWREVVAQNKLSGATVDRIPLSRFPRFPITIPPFEIIVRFDQVMRPMFKQIEVLSQKNLFLRAQRDLLLPKLISGEIDVSAFPEPEATRSTEQAVDPMAFSNTVNWPEEGLEFQRQARAEWD